MSTFISIVFGGLITILTALGVEYFRTPRLSLSIEQPPLDLSYSAGSPAQSARYLRLKLRNKSLGASWMQRSAALQCRGEVTFHHRDDGQNVFGRAMTVRWSSSPEPIANQIVDSRGDVRFHILDFSRAAAESLMDVYPGEEKTLDIAVRFDDEADCYGWNNDGYFFNWRNPNWKLSRERYLVKVVISSSGQKCVRVVRLVNDVDSRMDFRLENASADDLAKVR
jgi:hypothetical protein